MLPYFLHSQPHFQLQVVKVQSYLNIISTYPDSTTTTTIITNTAAAAASTTTRISPLDQ